MSANQECSCKPGGDGLPTELCNHCDQLMLPGVVPAPTLPVAIPREVPKPEPPPIPWYKRSTTVFVCGVLLGAMCTEAGEARRYMQRVLAEPKSPNVRIVKIPVEDFATPEMRRFHKELQEAFFSRCTKIPEEISRMSSHVDPFQRGYCFAKTEEIPMPEPDQSQAQLYRDVVFDGTRASMRFHTLGR